MRPPNTLTLLSEWLMRSGILLFALFYYGKNVWPANPGIVMFYVSAAYLLLSVLLFLGGFFLRSRLGNYAALGLLLITGYQTFIFMRAGLDYNFAVFVVLASVLFYFLVKGKSK